MKSTVLEENGNAKLSRSSAALLVEVVEFEGISGEVSMMKYKRGWAFIINFSGGSDCLIVAGCSRKIEVENKQVAKQGVGGYVATVMFSDNAMQLCRLCRSDCWEHNVRGRRILSNMETDRVIGSLSYD